MSMFSISKRTPHLFIISAILIIRATALSVFPPDVGGDNPNYYMMMADHSSNLIHAPGYPFIISRLIFFNIPTMANLVTTLSQNDASDIQKIASEKDSLQKLQSGVFRIVIIQNVLASVLLILIYALGIRLIGTFCSGAGVLVLAMTPWISAATSSLSPEWLQGYLAVLSVFLCLTAKNANANKSKLIYYIASFSSFLWAYLTKFNSAPLLLVLVILFILDKVCIRKKIIHAIAIALIVSAQFFMFLFCYHAPKAGTRILNTDHAWVLLDDNMSYWMPGGKYDIKPGPWTKRLLTINSLLPSNNHKLGAFYNINMFKSESDKFQDLRWVLSTDNSSIDNLFDQRLKTGNIDYNVKLSWNPVSIYIGLAEGDDLGVKVFIENIRSHLKDYMKFVLNIFTTELTRNFNRNEDIYENSEIIKSDSSVFIKSQKPFFISRSVYIYPFINNENFEYISLTTTVFQNIYIILAACAVVAMIIRLSPFALPCNETKQQTFTVLISCYILILSFCSCLVHIRTKERFLLDPFLVFCGVIAVSEFLAVLKNISNKRSID